MIKREMLRRVVLCLPLVLAVCGSPFQQSTFSSSRLAPLLQSLSTDNISRSYIVVFKQHAQQMEIDNHYSFITNVMFTQYNSMEDDLDMNTIKHVYDMDGFKGYAGKFSPDVLSTIRASTHVVELVECDQVMSASELITQQDATWGIARVSQRQPFSNPSAPHTYTYDTMGGSGVNAYVIDTGINLDHTEFEGRAIWGQNFVNSIDTDENGHGTHVSGTLGGITFGVAKNVTLIAVKVLDADGSGSTSGVLAGIQFVTNQHSAIRKNTGTARSVVNMSLGGGPSKAMDRVIKAAIASGVNIVVAAGNDGEDACLGSPARTPGVIAVGAMDSSDTVAEWSSIGPCVSIFAPGVGIKSAYKGSDTATKVLDGTSMASPHVAGLIAYFLSLNLKVTDTLEPSDLKKTLEAVATSGALKMVPSDTANLLAYNNVANNQTTDPDMPMPPDPAPPGGPPPCVQATNIESIRLQALDARLKQAEAMLLEGLLDFLKRFQAFLFDE